MNFKTKLAINVALFLLFACVGFPSFNVCRENGGALLSCGLVGWFVGFMQVVFFVYALFVALLVDGFAHLFGKS